MLVLATRRLTRCISVSMSSPNHFARPLTRRLARSFDLSPHAVSLCPLRVEYEVLFKWEGKENESHHLSNTMTYMDPQRRHRVAEAPKSIWRTLQ